MDWFDKEMDAIDLQLERGEITAEQHRREVRDLQRDAADEAARDDIRAAGRGHLLRD